jgi:hypothetical protein
VSRKVARAKHEQDICGPKLTEQGRIHRWRRRSAAQITVVAGMSGAEVRLIGRLIGRSRAGVTVTDDAEGIGRRRGL